jgi:hypothetical protein
VHHKRANERVFAIGSEALRKDRTYKESRKRRRVWWRMWSVEKAVEGSGGGDV